MTDRRSFLQGVSSLPLISASAQALPALTAAGPRDVLKELNVRTFINAAGTYTVLTASLMSPEVLEAMNQAARHFVNLNELHEAAGRRISELASL